MNTAKPTERDLLVYGAGYLASVPVSARCGRKLSRAQFVQESIPYAQAITQLIDDSANLRHPKVRAVRRALLQELPSLAAATRGQTALEQTVIDVADGMQKLWRRVNSARLQSPDYDEQIKHLPLAFLSWEKVQEYVEVAKRLFDLLQIPVSEANLRPAFYEFVAQQILHYGLYRAQSVGDIIHASSLLAADVSGFDLDEYRHLLMSPAAQEKLAPQFAQDGVGSFEQIRALAQVYQAGEQSQASRIEIAKRLAALMS